MPNTKSAERRVRNSVRKQAANKSRKSSVKRLEKKYLELVDTGKKDEASKVLRAVSSALDKAAKTGVIHASNASRRKSRLTVRLNKVKAAASVPAPAAAK
jgi:small subunit ribosomal protein S20